MPVDEYENLISILLPRKNSPDFKYATSSILDIISAYSLIEVKSTTRKGVYRIAMQTIELQKHSFRHSIHPHQVSNLRSQVSGLTAPLLSLISATFLLSTSNLSLNSLSRFFLSSLFWNL